MNTLRRSTKSKLLILFTLFVFLPIQEVYARGKAEPDSGSGPLSEIKKRPNAAINTGRPIFTQNTGNVRFEFVPSSPPAPFVAPNNSGHFGVNFRVFNLTNNDYDPGAFKVKLHASYSTRYSYCPNDHTIEINKRLEAKTGKIKITDYKFDEPVDPSCLCSTSNQCHGEVRMELQRINGDQAPGQYTKLRIQWDESGELSEMILEDKTFD